ncbi:Imm40 family immunity protein [Salidesulfovibrio onnuriiensis]|uniref:Imm40 family immunity protein n=1 Tax=Salidesulfovibrio onnuriiensis TaxID=2583823 RepID=UPI001650905C|nr:Imm40 family immunity protein [Salidesulfovibrio onnuriiensis]
MSFFSEKYDTTWPDIYINLLKRGIPIHEYGINNWLLSREDALFVANECKNNGIAIAGGDVYELLDHEPEPAHDNWYCEVNTNESFNNYISRSIAKTIEYISTYRHPRGFEPYFIFVPVFELK